MGTVLPSLLATKCSPTRSTTTKALRCRAFAMRRRGLEPPPGIPDQALNLVTRVSYPSDPRRSVESLAPHGRYGRIGRFGRCHGRCHAGRDAFRECVSTARRGGRVGPSPTARHDECLRSCRDSHDYECDVPSARAAARRSAPSSAARLETRALPTRVTANTRRTSLGSDNGSAATPVGSATSSPTRRRGASAPRSTRMRCR
jgi:hypothetical protein